MVKRKLEADFHFELDVIGIIAPIKEYKMAWLLNEHLQLAFVKQPNVSIELKSNRTMKVSNFLFEKELAIFRLLKNRLSDASQSATIHLINSLSQFDYIVTIDDQNNNFDAEQIKQEINRIDKVFYATCVDTNNLKEKENLII